jgi:hypothetical protein
VEDREDRISRAKENGIARKAAGEMARHPSPRSEGAERVAGRGMAKTTTARRDIELVGELYCGCVNPPFYGRPDLCGAVDFETKSRPLMRAARSAKNPRGGFNGIARPLYLSISLRS